MVFQVRVVAVEASEMRAKGFLRLFIAVKFMLKVKDLTFSFTD
jgi:hypothetical protein